MTDQDRDDAVFEIGVMHDRMTARPAPFDYDTPPETVPVVRGMRIEPIPDPNPPATPLPNPEEPWLHRRGRLIRQVTGQGITDQSVGEALDETRLATQTEERARKEGGE